MNQASERPQRTALLSVSDKNGITEFAKRLAGAGFRLLSTGGTATALREAGLTVVDVSEVTGFPEIMDGRVKTLHPKVHAGVLARRGVDDQVLATHDIDTIDVVVVNLYPFAETLQQADCNFTRAIENIDVGGPAMIRAAAKNHAFVAVVTDAGDYSRVADSIEKTGDVPAELRLELAATAFSHTARYDGVIAGFLTASSRAAAATDSQTDGLVQAGAGHKNESSRLLLLQQKQALRYGENPHQQAAFFVDASPRRVGDPNNPGQTLVESAATANLSDANSLQGKELSYNNIADAAAALDLAREFDETACVIVKHANPCGVAVADTALEAYQRAYACDPTSAFGGIIAINGTVDESLAPAIIDQQFVEVLLASEFTSEAIARLQSKPAVRVLELPSPWALDTAPSLKSAGGGYLIQSADSELLATDGCRVVTEREPDETQHRDLLFAWKVAKHVKSNAIVYARDRQSVGIGAGQMSRVYSARIAAIKAQDEGLVVTGAALASDAFFPFRDGIDQAAAAGITSIIQPGGSRNDDEVIKAANEHGMAMLFTGMRHFRH